MRKGRQQQQNILLCLPLKFSRYLSLELRSAEWRVEAHGRLLEKVATGVGRLTLFSVFGNCFPPSSHLYQIFKGSICGLGQDTSPLRNVLRFIKGAESKSNGLKLQGEIPEGKLAAVGKCRCLRFSNLSV